MSLHNDDSDVSATNGPEGFTESQAEALLSGRGASSDGQLAQLFSTMRAMGQVEPPAPSPLLAEMLDHGIAATALAPPAPAAGRARPTRRRFALRSAAAFGALCAALVGAAAANALPATAQNLVATIVETVTPAKLHHSHKQQHLPAPAVSPSPSVSPQSPDGISSGQTAAPGDTGNHGGSSSPDPGEHASSPTTGEDHGAKRGGDVSGGGDTATPDPAGLGGSGRDHGSSTPPTESSPTPDDHSSRGSDSPHGDTASGSIPSGTSASPSADHSSSEHSSDHLSGTTAASDS